MTQAWKTLDFGKVATLQRGYDLTYRQRKLGSVPVITSTGVTDTHAEARERGPGVITGRYGTIGEVFFINEDYWPHNTTLFVKDFHGNDPLFVSYLLRTIDFQSHSGKSGVPGVNRNDLHSLTVRVPPTVDEQRAIATALSDVDGLLGGLDRLIAKKRDLKQAAMQQLLTGQTRLPGFHGEWEVKRLGDVFTISAGKSKSAFIAENGDFWICDMGSVSIAGRLIVSKRTNHRCDFLRKGDLIMPKDDIGGGNIIGKVGYIDANETYILGDHVYCLRALEGDSRFLAYTINSHRVNSELRKKVIGSAQLGLGRKSVTEQEIQIPPTPEQAAIAEVLTDIDAELAALEQRREKTRALKQAMMQELLTGRTRLV